MSRRDKAAEVRRPSIAELGKLVPLRGLSERDLVELAKQAQIVQAHKPLRILSHGQVSPYAYFVLRGEVVLMAGPEQTRIVSGGSAEANFPLSSHAVADGNAINRSSAVLLRIPWDGFQQARAMVQAQHNSGVHVEEGGLENVIYRDFWEALHKGALELPSMPDIALRIAEHVEAPSCNSTSIARMVQMDPSLTTRLVQVANSPAYGGEAKIESCRDAITRLGRATTRNLVNGLVLKSVFNSRFPLLRRRMSELWQHSTRVAALSQAIAFRTPALEPSQAMLAGLIHDIGIIPILNNAPKYPGLADDPQVLDQAIHKLRGDFGAMTLRKWKFAPEFIDVALVAEDWHRDGGETADYADCVIIAQMHNYIGSPRMAELPPLDEVPAFHKLALGQLSPTMSIRILDEAEQEISVAQQLLS